MTMAPRWLEQAVRRGNERPWTLGAVLAEYCHDEGLTWEDLSSFLGCSVESLSWLSLCRRPDPEQFADDVVRIAERFQIEPKQLAQVVRRVDAVRVLRQPSQVEGEESLLLAARDRDKEKDE